jgi:helicase
MGKGLALLADALFEKDTAKLSAAARIIEFMCDQGHVSRRSEPVLRVMSAFAFEACGESPRSKRSYRKLFDVILPLDEVLGSKELAKELTQSIVYYGMRQLDGFRILAESFFEELKTQQKHLGFKPDISTNSDFIVILGILDVLLTYCEALEGRVPLSNLAVKTESLDETAATSSSWIAILARLVCHMLSSVTERSILNLPLSKYTESRLVSRGITELWMPQAEAVSKGLLRGNNIVYSTGTATGKSLLAYLLAESASVDKKVIYIVPTRTLANEAFRVLTDMVDINQNPIAVTTRERSEFDDSLSEYAIIIATYEKFDSLLKQKRIVGANIKCLIADEVHFISNRERGIPLEFTLTEMKSKVGADDPQIIALSAMINTEDAEQMSSWLQASKIRTDWRPVELDEMIFYNGKLYHKNGVEEVRPPIRLHPEQELKLLQRTAIISRLARDSLVRDGQCMIVVQSRKDAEKVANEISIYLENSRFFDPDSREQLSIKEEEREKLRRDIQRSEPELPVCAQKLFQLMKNGVAYHHAGLPAKYRGLIERGVRDQLVKVLVTTTTFEVGVNLPISLVIFVDIRRGNKDMSIRTYKNLAGRAGRPEFDVKGESIIITLTKEEFERIRNRYFDSIEEPLESSIKYFMKKQPVPRYIIQSEILEMAAEHDIIHLEDLMSFMKRSWFWTRADENTRMEFAKRLSTELFKLEVFGFVKRTKNAYKVTNSGKAAAKGMLSPFSMKNLINNARRVFEGSHDQESQTILLLSLVGIPYEVGDNDEIVKRVKTLGKCEFVSSVLSQDQNLYEPAERMQLCPQYATVLYYWINSLPTEQILKQSNLDPTADAALFEELLPNDAYWVLNTLASVPYSALPVSKEQHDFIMQLATWCKLGSSDNTIIELLNLGLNHIGRNTAIKLAEHIRMKNKRIEDLTESDLCELFPTNQESAKLLFDELQAKKMLNHS